MTNHDIVPTHLVIKAMRDSGYKNAAYAVAELMDNSIQAEASNVELLCGEKIERLKHRSLLVYRRFNRSYAIWQGSDVDIEERLQHLIGVA